MWERVLNLVCSSRLSGGMGCEQDFVMSYRAMSYVFGEAMTSSVAIVGGRISCRIHPVNGDGAIGRTTQASRPSFTPPPITQDP